MTDFDVRTEPTGSKSFMGVFELVVQPRPKSLWFVPLLTFLVLGPLVTVFIVLVDKGPAATERTGELIGLGLFLALLTACVVSDIWLMIRFRASRLVSGVELDMKNSVRECSDLELLGTSLYLEDPADRSNPVASRFLTSDGREAGGMLSFDSTTGRAIITDLIINPETS